MEQDNENHRDQLEKEYWEPVGRFIFAFGDLERLVDEFLIDLLGIDYRIAGKFTLSEIDFLARANLLKAFCRGTAAEKEMKEVVTEIEQLNTFRNRLIHGTWSAHFESTEGNTHFHKIG